MRIAHNEVQVKPMDIDLASLFGRGVGVRELEPRDCPITLRVARRDGGLAVFQTPCGSWGCPVCRAAKSARLASWLREVQGAFWNIVDDKGWGGLQKLARRRRASGVRCPWLDAGQNIIVANQRFAGFLFLPPDPDYRPDVQAFAKVLIPPPGRYLSRFGLRTGEAPCPDSEAVLYWSGEWRPRHPQEEWTFVEHRRGGNPHTERSDGAAFYRFRTALAAAGIPVKNEGLGFFAVPAEHRAEADRIWAQVARFE